MHRGFYLGLSVVSGIIFIIYMALIVYKEATPEWKAYQNKYRTLLIKNASDGTAEKKARSLAPRMKQIYIAKLERADRCINCHIGIDNPLMAKADLPLVTHSGDYLKQHPVNNYGCTICHKGQGLATNKKDAHGTGSETHWDYPVIPFDYIESTCAGCHDFAMLEKNGFKKVAKGERVFRISGCKGCHKLEGVGGVLGNSLDGVGFQPISYFPMAHVEGAKTSYSWMKEHFDDPINLVLDSKMLSNLTDEEANLLTTYILSLQSDEIHKDYRRIDSSAKIKISEDEGESLYKMYCVACHGTGKDSVYDGVFERTIPAIMNPAFLGAADNKILKTMISEGRADTQMTAWKTDAAGLEEHEIDKIIEYITKDRPVQRAKPFGVDQFDGDLQYGEDLYKIRCSSCHGDKGQ